MAAPKLDPADVWRAIHLYLESAYSGDIPVTVRSQLAILRSWGGEFFKAPVFAANADNPPTRYTMRLGNRFYPHMKLAFQLSPDGSAFLFAADTHDRHLMPPEGAPEYADIRALAARNQELAANIEHEWATHGLPTFRQYLKDDLQRRQKGAGS